MATKKTTKKKAPSKTRTRAKTDANVKPKNARQGGQRSTTKGGKTAVKRGAAASKNGTTLKGASAKTSNVKRAHKSVLDAAATILAGASTPKSCGEMIDAILKRKLWTTQGKTPAATLSSAILRDIKKNGKQSRFAKAERGRFRRSSTA